MSLFYSTDNPDSLDVLLKKAHAVNTINKETLAHIQIEPCVKKRRTSPDAYHINNVIKSWRYYGVHPLKEKIAFDGFIDVIFSTFDDLIRLVDDYHSLLEKYELTLKDVKESRVAVEVVLRNVELLQVAIGEVHTLILDGTNGQSYMESFTNIEALKCKHTFPKKVNLIDSLEVFDANGKQYIFAGGFPDTLVWDLSNHKVVAKLPIRDDSLLFVKDGVQMIANKHWSDKKIDIWNLSTQKKEVTLCDEELYGRHGKINTFTVYYEEYDEEDDSPMLFVGCECGTLILWDLDRYEVIAFEDSIDAGIKSLHVYHDIGCRSYLVCCRKNIRKFDFDYEPIEVWDIEEQKIIGTFETYEDTEFVFTMSRNYKQILMVLGRRGDIYMWNLETFDKMGYIELPKDFDCDNVRCYEVLDCRGKQYLACSEFDKTIKIWDIENKSKVVTLNTELKVTAMTVFMNGNKPCLVTGGGEHFCNIKRKEYLYYL